MNHETLQGNAWLYAPSLMAVIRHPLVDQGTYITSYQMTTSQPPTTDAVYRELQEQLGYNGAEFLLVGSIVGEPDMARVIPIIDREALALDDGYLDMSALDDGYAKLLLEEMDVSGKPGQKTVYVLGNGFYAHAKYIQGDEPTGTLPTAFLDPESVVYTWRLLNNIQERERKRQLDQMCPAQGGHKNGSNGRPKTGDGYHRNPDRQKIIRDLREAEAEKKRLANYLTSKRLPSHKQRERKERARIQQLEKMITYLKSV